MGYFKMESASAAKDLSAGEAIIAVSKSVFNYGQDSAWVPFVKDTKKWIFDQGYRYHNDDGSVSQPQGPGKPAGYAPDDLEIVVMHDSEKRMHVRVPWHAALTKAAAVPVPLTENYSGKFPILLARYFMRSCR